MAEESTRFMVGFAPESAAHGHRRERASRSVRLDQFVLAVFCTDTNSVASIMPVPSGVGMVIL